MAVAEAKVFDKWIDIAFSIAFWTFVRSTPVIDINASPIESKHNSMLVMMYLNALRIIFDRILEDDKKGLLSVNFTKKLAAIGSDEEMKVFVQQTFKSLLDKPENLDDQLPNFDQADSILKQMCDGWKESKNFQQTAQIKWISNLKMAFKKMSDALKDKVLNKSIHELIISIMYTLVTSPKALLHNYPCMALLGSVSKKLYKFTNWNKKLYKTIVESNRRKNTGPFVAPNTFNDFFKKATTQNAPYIRIMMTDIFDIFVDTELWHHKWTSEHLDCYIAIFNKVSFS